MADQEDSACEIPLKRPRLHGDECDELTKQKTSLISNVPNKGDSQPQMNSTSFDGAAVIAQPSLPSTDLDQDVMESDSMNMMKANSGSPIEEDDTGAGANSDSENLSDISELSGLSEDAWKPIAGPISWVQRQMTMGRDPREILQELVTADTVIPSDLDDFTMWRIIINLMSEPPKRKKLNHINTLDDVLELLTTCKKIMVLTGAGVSVSCGIPDFRSRDGIYARLAVDFPDLPDPQAMFDIRYFRNDPRPFFKFAKEIYPGQFEPSRCHKFIQMIDQHNKLLRNYTQNIDTLEQVAGIKNVIQCHGSFAGATCMECHHKVTADDIKEDIFNQIIPHCPVCPADSAMSILKPDIVFFGESLPEEFHKQMAEDKDECDLLIVIGSSLKVRPVALIPNSIPSHVPQILINREPLTHMDFDIELLGDCDCIISELCKRLGAGWSHLADQGPSFTEIRRTELAAPTTLNPVTSHDSGTHSVREEEPGHKLNIGSSTDVASSKDNGEHFQSSGSTGNDSVRNDVCGKVTSPISTTVGDATGSSQGTSTNAETNGVSDVENKTNNERSSIEHNEHIEKPSVQNSSPSKAVAVTSPVEEEPSPLKASPVASSVQEEPSPSKAEGGTPPVEDPSPSKGAGVTSPAEEEEEELGDTAQEDEKDLYGTLDTSLEEMKKIWHAKDRQSIAKRLKDDQYLFLPPCRYVFHGAEVMSTSTDNDSDDDPDSVLTESRHMHSSQDEAGDGDIATSVDTTTAVDMKTAVQHAASGDKDTSTEIKVFEGDKINGAIEMSSH